MLKVIVFSGGRGSNSIVKELLKDPTIKLSLIVNAYDDGKSTGEIRRFFNMLGPSDIRKNQQILMSDEFTHYKVWHDILKYRFPNDIQYESCIKLMSDFAEGRTNILGDIYIEDSNLKQLIQKLITQFIDSTKIYEKVTGRAFDFSDCSLSNCLYAGAYELLDKSFIKTIDLFNVLLHTRGNVIPTNFENKKLVAIRETGEICYNEAEIVELRSSDRIRDLFLIDEYMERDLIERKFHTLEEKSDYLNRFQSYVHATPDTVAAIKCADIIIYAPGTQHSSLYPSYMTLGIPEAIYSNKKALKIFVCNIGEDYETPDYSASEFVLGTYKYLNRNCKIKIPMEGLMNVALINNSRSNMKENVRYVENDFEKLERLPINIVYGKYELDEDLGKHDACNTVSTINKIYYKKFFKDFAYVSNN